jgi:hypothetical protein
MKEVISFLALAACVFFGYILGIVWPISFEKMPKVYLNAISATDTFNIPSPYEMMYNPFKKTYIIRKPSRLRGYEYLHNYESAGSAFLQNDIGQVKECTDSNAIKNLLKEYLNTRSIPPENYIPVK